MLVNDLFSCTSDNLSLIYHFTRNYDWLASQNLLILKCRLTYEILSRDFQRLEQCQQRTWWEFINIIWVIVTILSVLRFSKSHWILFMFTTKYQESIEVVWFRMIFISVLFLQTGLCVLPQKDFRLQKHKHGPLVIHAEYFDSTIDRQQGIAAECSLFCFSNWARQRSFTKGRKDR